MTEQTLDLENSPNFPCARTWYPPKELFDTYSAMNREELHAFVERVRQNIDALYLDKADDIYMEGLICDLMWLGHIGEASAFPTIKSLLKWHPDDLGDFLGEDFLTEDLPRLLAATAKARWLELFDYPFFEEEIRSACLDACEQMVLMGELDREVLIDAIKRRFQQIIDHQDESEDYITDLVHICLDLWPGECVEEIKELFGLRFIDEDDIDIDEVLESWKMGKDACIAQLSKPAPFVCVEEHDPKNSGPKAPDVRQPDLATIDKLLSLVQKEMEEEEVFGRNSPCPCGSGKKYKKCCLNRTCKTVGLETMRITGEPLVDWSEMDSVDREFLLNIHHHLATEPESVIIPLKKLVEKHPEKPAIYNYLYVCHAKLGDCRQAHKILRQTVEKFPDYFFGRMEFANYLLRRGEPEKVEELFQGARTMNQLFPEREVFHISEVLSFHYVVARYYLAQKEFIQAKVHSDLLKQIRPESNESQTIERDLDELIRKQRVRQLIKRFKKD